MRANETSNASRIPPDVCAVERFDAAVVARLRDSGPSDEVLSEAELLFGALADRTRLRIVAALTQAKELCVCDVAELLGASVSAASHHLRKMRDLRILRHRTDGKMVYYSLLDERAAELVARVLPSKAPRKARAR